MHFLIKLNKVGSEVTRTFLFIDIGLATISLFVMSKYNLRGNLLINVFLSKNKRIFIESKC